MTRVSNPPPLGAGKPPPPPAPPRLRTAKLSKLDDTPIDARTATAMIAEWSLLDRTLATFARDLRRRMSE